MSETKDAFDQWLEWANKPLRWNLSGWQPHGNVFDKQAATYRKLAAERTKKFGLDDPRYWNLSKDE
jgi:hypothetical protein